MRKAMLSRWSVLLTRSSLIRAKLGFSRVGGWITTLRRLLSRCHSSWLPRKRVTRRLLANNLDENPEVFPPTYNEDIGEDCPENETNKY